METRSIDDTSAFSPNTYHFNPTEAPKPFTIHKSQGVFLSGDSGGPLLFRTQGQFQVAGVANVGTAGWIRQRVLPVVVKSYLHLWASVPDAIEWIDQITQ